MCMPTTAIAPPPCKDYTRALELDPKMATGYVNRGFVLNDLREPTQAAKDFQTALQLDPRYGEAHLGLALRRPATASSHDRP